MIEIHNHLLRLWLGRLKNASLIDIPPDLYCYPCSPLENLGRYTKEINPQRSLILLSSILILLTQFPILAK